MTYCSSCSIVSMFSAVTMVTVVWGVSMAPSVVVVRMVPSLMAFASVIATCSVKLSVWRWWWCLHSPRCLGSRLRPRYARWSGGLRVIGWRSAAPPSWCDCPSEVRHIEQYGYSIWMTNCSFNLANICFKLTLMWGKFKKWPAADCLELFPLPPLDLLPQLVPGKKHNQTKSIF